MQFLKVNKGTSFSSICNKVGLRNVEQLLALNGLTRSPNIGAQYIAKCSQIVSQTAQNVDWGRKAIILNSFVESADVFEKCALADEDEWKIIDKLGSFKDYLKVPESIKLPHSNDVLGDGIHVSRLIYDKCMKQLKDPPHQIDPANFNEYSSIKPSKILDYKTASQSEGDPFQWFHLPWGDLTLYSSLSDSSIDFPVYPNELEDERVANYDTMPEMLYQYEPWQVYKSSGPRSVPLSFDMHRDMWSGDHRDGKCNELIRFCQANCYPQYKGSAVNPPRVSFYIKGQCLISGVITDVRTTWDGPIGLDGYYLHCVLNLNIIEISETKLDFDTVKNKPIIG